MIQCESCEFFERDSLGNPVFRCDPFSNIKEEACLAKWQIIQLNQVLAAQRELSQSYQATSDFQQRMAPLQEQVFKMVQREVNDIEEGDAWKQAYEEEDEDTPGWS